MTVNETKDSIFDDLRSEMERVGFVFEKEQKPYLQGKKAREFKFIHPELYERLKEEGLKVRGQKYYIKPLSDKSDCEIGLVNGKSTPLAKSDSFPKPNAVDEFDDSPAWVNRNADSSLNDLLSAIGNYVDNDSFFPELVPAELEIHEGLKKQVTVNQYERSRVARTKCIERHGCDCKVCGFNFSEFYGELGSGFIHVHHVKPLHTIGKDYKVDYENDLIPVCPNCHAMLHRKFNGSELSLDELRKIIREKQ
jgi:hypothetical protein